MTDVQVALKIAGKIVVAEIIKHQYSSHTSADEHGEKVVDITKAILRHLREPEEL